ncbi:hypothetical protein E2C01_067771 [Portunus trituberculatus]|uniref:Uncharacterized protein n=1 Tax=Portunus trituberculatus TaxID=210409 RepID=A0A5B7HQ73_PORTR|nr:hypothetical protein [Portunus trituberculatus]
MTATPGKIDSVTTHSPAAQCQPRGHHITGLYLCVDVEESGGGGGGGGSAGSGVRGGGKKTKVAGDAQPYLEEAAMRKMVSSVRGAAYRPTLPPEIATDAAIYVAVSGRARKRKKSETKRKKSRRKGREGKARAKKKKI